jgi:hypothetical protein
LLVEIRIAVQRDSSHCFPAEFFIYAFATMFVLDLSQEEEKLKKETLKEVEKLQVWLYLCPHDEPAG